MRKCSCCLEFKELDEFSKQKTKPMFYYAWCDLCRAEAKQGTVVKPMKVDYLQEVNDMRRKAAQLRKFTPEQAKELKRRYQAGEKVTALAAEHHTSTNSVYKAINGYKLTP